MLVYRLAASIALVIGLNSSLSEAWAVPLPPLPSEPVSVPSAEPDVRLQNLIAQNEAPTSSSPVATPSLLPSGKLQIQAEDSATGKTTNIDINSNDLQYDPTTKVYTLDGDVYIIVPDKGIEVLADHVVFNSETSDMTATGRVFIIKGEEIVGTEKAWFDFNTNVSHYLTPKTVLNSIRIQSETATRTPEVTVLKSGRLIVDGETLSRLSYRYRSRGLRLGKGAIYSFYSSSRFSQMMNNFLIGRIGDPDVLSYDLSSTVLDADPSASFQFTQKAKPISPNDVANADFSPSKSNYKLDSKRIDIYDRGRGFDEIVLQQPTFRYKNLPLLWMPNMDFGYSNDRNFLTYLGPDIGYNVDYGGFYVGPGWDTRIGKGWLRFSPTITYGGGDRLDRSASRLPDTVATQFGFGVIGHYRSPHNQTDFGHSFTLREPIFLMSQALGDSNTTRLRAAMNQYYVNGFFGIERPQDAIEVNDLRQFQINDGKWLLRTYASAGWAKDEFFPTRQRRFFVDPTSTDPISTMRLQLQGQFRPNQPIFYLGKYGAVSALTQARLSYYGTGDFYGIFQGGPVATLFTGPVFSQVRYLYSQTVGNSPFVFDSFFQGRNNIQSINSIDLGKRLTIGTVNGFSLNRDNARDDLIVDQKFFISVGSKNAKFSLAYDTIQKRAFFGLTLNPEGGQLSMDFDQLNKYAAGQTRRNTPPLPPFPLASGTSLNTPALGGF